MKVLVLTITVLLLVITSSLTIAQNDTCGSDIQLQVKQDLVILNYALSLEHLEYAFYRDGLEHFNESVAVSDNFTDVDYSYLSRIRDDELAHVNALSDTISGLDGTPVQECQYNFDFDSMDFDQFLATAALLENTGAGAYLGVLSEINDKDLLTSGASIAMVEARHASWLNYKTGAVPFPNAFETPLNQSEVLSRAAQFISSCPTADTQCYGIDQNDPSVCSGNGVCQGTDLCFCEAGFTGPQCNCTSKCPFCDSENECCADLTKGNLCYNVSTHHCVENQNGDLILCGLGDGACGTVCFDEELYSCDADTGKIEPIQGVTRAINNEAEEFDIQIVAPPKKLESVASSPLVSSITIVFMLIIMSVFIVL